MIYVVAPGIAIANDRVIEGIESVFGPDITIFGATSSDNMKGIRSLQAIDQDIHEHSIFAVGFSDPTLEVFTQATHGFIAKDEPMTVRKAEGNRIIELNGRPAWPEYLSRLGLPDDAALADTIPIGAAAERLNSNQASCYGYEYILRVITHKGPDDSLIYATECPEGAKIWLTARDEELIFSDLDRLVAQITAKAGARKPVAVFQADCLARGRRLFNRVLKEELVQRMQFPFSTEGLAPPWLGMYGFGEYARLGERNAYHNYTTALALIYRK